MKEENRTLRTLIKSSSNYKVITHFYNMLLNHVNAQVEMCNGTLHVSYMPKYTNISKLFQTMAIIF